MQFTFGADGAAMREHDVLHDRESEAGAAGFAGTGLIDTVEAFEESRQVLGRNAWAKITYEELHAIGMGTRAENQARSGAGVLEGVFYEIREHLMNGFAVGRD